MSSTFAYIALFSWPLVVVVLFLTLPLPRALTWAIVGGYLFLPEKTGISIPAGPTLNKVFLPSMAATIMCLFALWRMRASRPKRTRRTDPAPSPGDRRTRKSPPRRGRVLVWGLILVTLFSPFAIVMANGAPVIAGPRYIPGLRLYDAFSMGLGATIMLMPFVLARHFLTTREAHRMVLEVLVAAGLIYSLLALVEVRLSPQLHYWIYGFFQHSFIQHLRDGGFRPIVFLQHGLEVGMFLGMTCLAALALLRDDQSRRPVLWGVAALWLLAVLVLCKTLGPLAITLVMIPAMLLPGQKLRLLIAAALAGIVLLYPMLRGGGLVPVNTIHALASTVDPSRAASLQYRFNSEDLLLEKASQKPFLGWGGWGRSRVFDPETGEDMVATDGAWVISIGSFGWVGYLARFGLLTVPILILALRQRQYGTGPPTVGLALVLAANLVDLLPNSSLTPLTWFIAGALVGYYEAGPQPASEAAPGRDPRRAPVTRRPLAPAPARRA